MTAGIVTLDANYPRWVTEALSTAVCTRSGLVRLLWHASSLVLAACEKAIFIRSESGFSQRHAAQPNFAKRHAIYISLDKCRSQDFQFGWQFIRIMISFARCYSVDFWRLGDGT